MLRKSALALVACFGLTPAVALALPSFARREGVSCVTCHSMVPRLNRTGYEYRNAGYGRQIMQYSIEKMQELYPNQSIKIGAQQYLEKFYSSLGFVQSGEMYLEDDIPHIPMILTKI